MLYASTLDNPIPHGDEAEHYDTYEDDHKLDIHRKSISEAHCCETTNSHSPLQGNPIGNNNYKCATTSNEGIRTKRVVQ